MIKKYNLIFLFISKIIFILNFLNVLHAAPPKKFNILIPVFWSDHGGVPVHRGNLCKYLLAQNCSIFLFFYTPLAKKNFFEKFPELLGRCKDIVCTNNWQNSMELVCKKEKINIIHCNHFNETKHAINVGLLHKEIAVILTHHGEKFNQKNQNIFTDIDCFIGVNSFLVNTLQKESIKINSSQLMIPIIEFLPPVFDAEKFLNFKAQKSDKYKFFMNEYKVVLEKNVPVLCMIANFYPIIKRHDLLVRAVNILINTLKIPVQLIFAGSHYRIQEIKDLVKELKLESVIHFIGQTKQTPSLLFYSDIKLLISETEAFPIALIEGAMMKKPLIGTRGTGMENIIVDKKTGLLSEKNSPQDIANQIKFLIDNPLLAESFGQSAFDRVTSLFLPDITIKKLLEIYDKALLHKKEKIHNKTKIGLF